MIRYLGNNEIDRIRWDSCIGSCPGVRPYGYSWYLDIMAPGWSALVEGDYESLFPIPGLKKYGIQYISTPIFLQQLGVYSPDMHTPGIIDRFLDLIPKHFRLIDLCVGQEVKHENYKVSVRTNLELDLSYGYDELWDNYLPHGKKNVKTSMRYKQELVDDIKPEEIIGLFRRGTGRKIKEIKYRNYCRLSDLMNYCLSKGIGRIIGVRGKDSKPCFGIFIIETHGWKTMIFMVNTPESRKKMTGYYAVNELIRESAGTSIIFDFTGSSMPSIAFFLESFGSKKVPYYRIYRNTLPRLLRYFK
jgi:hypothetical protein